MSTKKSDTKRIRAAASLISQISSGIYRSPANALKELVSNSFDAGASQVRITTDHPTFSNLSCYDNGPGITSEQFERIFGFIGGSNKRIEGDTGEFGRPLIGKLGIGILGMSQISKQFVIISTREGEPYRIEVEIDIEEFEGDEASTTQLGGGTIGEYTIYEIPESPELHYTIVTTPAGSRALRNILGKGESPLNQFPRTLQDEPENFKSFVEQIEIRPSGEQMNTYEQFLWEMATLCPVNYFEDGPVNGWHGWDHVKQQVAGYQFSLIVDGYEINKPVLLPTNPDLDKQATDYQIYPFSYETNNENGLKFDGYVFHQRSQIIPPELRGLLIRLKGVGIGGYDTSFLNYPRSISPMFRGMSGEVFVRQGLEDALNIDRNSFNETHPQYVELQTFLFRFLGVPTQIGIMTSVQQRSRERQILVKEDRTAEWLDSMTARLQRLTGEEWSWVNDDSLDVPLMLSAQGRLVFVNISHDTVPKALVARMEFYRVLLAVHLMVAERSDLGDTGGLVRWLRDL